MVALTSNASRRCMEVVESRNGLLLGLYTARYGVSNLDSASRSGRREDLVC